MNQETARKEQPRKDLSKNSIIHKTAEKIRKSSIFIPFLIFIFLLAIYLLTSNFSQQKPDITAISPEIGYPGEFLEIRGRNFGDPPLSSEGRLQIKPVECSVYISGNRLVLSDFLLWEDKLIRIRIPENVVSGSVFVENKNGKSNEILFINKKEIPTVVSGPVEPGHPFISSFEPTEASVSDIVVINGMNFGMEKGSGQVYFSLAAAGSSSAITEAAEDLFIAAAEADYDYISWADNEIRVRVPDGASSGKMWVKTDRGESNSVYLEKNENTGIRSFGEKRGYQVKYRVDIDVFEADNSNSIHLWVPALPASPEQRNIEYERNIKPDLDNYHNLMLYKFENLQGSETRKIEITAWFERYEVQTRINRNRTAWNYDKGTQFYREYTRDLFDIKLDDPRLDDGFRRVVKNRDPFTTAESIYNTTRRMEYTATPPARNDVIENFIQLKGDSYTYAMIFTALARKAGIPARPVAGFLVYDNKKAVKHFWSEFYIRNFGWVPVDPAIGDGASFGNIPQVDNPSEYYFGNLDSSHITFSRGIVSVPVISPDGRNIFKNRMYSLQTSYEEVRGNIRSYRTLWNDLEIVEWW